MKDWFIKKVLLSRVFVIDQPGFVTGRYFEQLGFGHFSRHVFLSESMLADFEKELCATSPKNKARLYQIAKNGTLRFAKMMGMPVADPKKGGLDKQAQLLFNFLSTMYASEMTPVVRGNALTLTIKDTGICRLNGLGHFLPCGCVAGLWAYLLSDDKNDAQQVKCYGRGDSDCVVNCSVSIKEYGKVKHISLPEEQSYVSFNKPVPFAGSSMSALIKNGMFSYTAGKLERQGERFFPFEIGYYYLFEQLASSLSSKEKPALSTVTAFYAKLSKTVPIAERDRFAVDFLKATGWGDPSVLREKSKRYVVISHFPYSGMVEKETKFLFFAAMLSGLFGDKFVFRKKLVKDNLILRFEES